MDPQRCTEVKSIFLNACRKLARLSAGERPDLVTLHPYNAASARAKKPGKRKNYLAEAITEGRAQGLPEYVLFQCDPEQIKKTGKKKAYRTNSTLYYNNKTRHIISTEIKDKKIFQNDRPANGSFIYGADRVGKLYITQRWIEYYDLPESEYIQKKLKKYPIAIRSTHSAVLAGQAGICFGYIDIRDGKVTYIDNKTGHYRCTIEHLCNFFNKTNILDCFAEYAVIKKCDRNQKSIAYHIEELRDLRSEVAKKWGDTV